MKIPSVVLVVLALGWAIGCSSGPPSPKPGSPGFFWAVARESYRTGDLVKTNSTLVELSRSENEFTARARVWQLVVSAGVSQGFSELADAYEAGARMNLTSPLRFRNQTANLRSMAASAALEFTQAVRETVDFDKGPNVQLAFGYPNGSTAQPEGLKKISNGIWLPDSEREALQAALLQRGVLLAVSRAVGSPDDPAKAQAVFQTAEVRIPRSTFLFGMGKLLYEESDLFGPERMDRPNRLLSMCGEALKALQSIPETEDTKMLAGEIQSAIKKLVGPGA